MACTFTWLQGSPQLEASRHLIYNLITIFISESAIKLFCKLQLKLTELLVDLYVVVLVTIFFLLYTKIIHQLMTSISNSQKTQSNTALPILHQINRIIAKSQHLFQPINSVAYHLRIVLLSVWKTRILTITLIIILMIMAFQEVSLFKGY